MKKRNTAMIVVAGILVLLLALGVTAVFAQTDQDPDTPPETVEQPPFHHWDKRGFGGRIEGAASHDELIADELGVDVEELRGAFAAAFEAAREDGVLGFPGKRGLDSDGEFESHLADALAEIGVSTDELKAAQEAVKDAMIADLLEQGVLTQEQLDNAEAQRALKEYIDYPALMAQAADSLGIELPDADEALENRLAPWTLMEQLEEKGITIQDLMEAVQQAYENAVDNAVSEGVIDSDQAQLILENGFGYMQGFGGIRGFGGMKGFGSLHGFGGAGECDGRQGFAGMQGHGRMHGFRSGSFHGFGQRGNFGPQFSNPAPTGVSL